MCIYVVVKRKDQSVSIARPQSLAQLKKDVAAKIHSGQKEIRLYHVSVRFVPFSIQPTKKNLDFLQFFVIFCNFFNFFVKGNVTALISSDAELKQVLASSASPELHLSVGGEAFEHVVDITPRCDFFSRNFLFF
jgi:hypothetical protein